jgi:hypothetical protein
MEQQSDSTPIIDSFNQQITLHYDNQKPSRVDDKVIFQAVPFYLP